MDIKIEAKWKKGSFFSEMAKIVHGDCSENEKKLQTDSQSTISDVCDVMGSSLDRPMIDKT